MAQTIQRGKVHAFPLATTGQVLQGPTSIRRIRLTTTETDGTKVVYVEHSCFEDVGNADCQEPSARGEAKRHQGSS